MESVVLPRSHPFNPILVVAESQVEQLFHALMQLSANDGWAPHATGNGGQRGPLSSFLSRPGDVSRIRCRRRLNAHNGRRMNTRFEDIIIEVWEVLGDEVERVDGDYHFAGTLHRRISM